VYASYSAVNHKRHTIVDLRLADADVAAIGGRDLSHIRAAQAFQQQQ
jgi:hypothetical protein